MRRESRRRQEQAVGDQEVFSQGKLVPEDEGNRVFHTCTLELCALKDVA